MTNLTLMGRPGAGSSCVRSMLGNARKPLASLAVVMSACAAFAGAEWSGSDLLLRGEDGAVYRHELKAGDAVSAGNIYISKNDCGAALVATGATITASGNVYLGYQYKTSTVTTVSLALTNTTMTVKGSLIVDSIPDKSTATLTLGPDSQLTAACFQNNSGTDAKIYFNGGRLKTTSSDKVFNPSGHGWYKNSSGGWYDGWPNRHTYVYANEGPIDITIEQNAKMAQGNSGRGLYLSGTKGFVKRGKGVLDWVWYPAANDGYIFGDVNYTGDTVVKEGGIRVGDTWTYKSGGDTRRLRNPMPPQSPLILEAGTFLDVSSNASTWCSISGAGIVTNRTTAMRGKVMLGGTVTDCELSPSSVGGAVDVYKNGSGTLTVDTAGIDGSLVISNGTVKIASGSTLKVKRIALLPNTTLDARGATLKDVVLELNGRTVGFATVSDVYVSVKGLAGGTVTFGEDGSDATMSAVAEAGVRLVKKGSGTMTVQPGRSAGELVVEGGTVRYAEVTPRGYRHFRFKVDGVYKPADASGMQFSEVKLLIGNENVTGLRSGFQYAPYIEETNYSKLDYEYHTSFGGEIVTKIVDGSLGTKWLDYRARASRIANEGDDLYIQIDYASDMVITAYSWATANDGGPGNDGRDPAAWRLLASDDGTVWEELDKRVGMGPYATRNAWVGEFAVTYPASRYDYTATFASVVVKSGATFDFSGRNGVFGTFVNQGGTILRDADTPVVLSAEAGTEVRVKSDGSAIAADVVKVGEGANTLLGTWAVDGRLTVSNGTLRAFVDGFGGKFFRMTITKNNGASGWTQFAEFYLYDKNGAIIDDHRPYSLATVGSDPSTLQAGQVCERIQHTDYSPERIYRAFDNQIFSGNTENASKFAPKMTPTQENPIVFYFRMPADTPHVCGYNFVEANDMYGTRNPVSWKLEGSYDGITWLTLDEKVDAVTPNKNSTIDTKTGIVTAVFFNDGVPYEIIGAGDPDEGDELPFGENAVVSVAEGATLAFGSAKMELSALAVNLDADRGVIERFTPAAEGALYVTTSGDPRQLCAEGPVQLFTVGELLQPRRLRKWTVTVNGVADEKLCVRWRRGSFVLMNTSGLAVVVR